MKPQSPLRHILLKSFEEYADAVTHFEMLKRLNQYKGSLTIAPVSYGYGVYITEDSNWRALEEFI